MIYTVNSENVGAPFPKRFDTTGEIIAVDPNGLKVTVSYHNKDGIHKTATFTVNNPQGYEIGELVSVQLADEFVFISKWSGNLLSDAVKE